MAKAIIKQTKRLAMKRAFTALNLPLAKQYLCFALLQRIMLIPKDDIVSCFVDMSAKLPRQIKDLALNFTLW